MPSPQSCSHRQTPSRRLSGCGGEVGRAVEVTFSEQMGDGVTTPGNYTISVPARNLASESASVSWLSGNKCPGMDER